MLKIQNQTLVIIVVVCVTMIAPISKIFVDVLSLMVNACVMNQSKGYWLLIDALFVAITMS
jgi:hypothetical protein